MGDPMDDRQNARVAHASSAPDPSLVQQADKQPDGQPPATQPPLAAKAVQRAWASTRPLGPKWSDSLEQF